MVPKMFKLLKLGVFCVCFSDQVQHQMRPISMEDLQFGVNKVKESKQTMTDTISMIQLD